MPLLPARIQNLPNPIPTLQNNPQEHYSAFLQTPAHPNHTALGPGCGAAESAGQILRAVDQGGNNVLEYV